MIDLGYIKREFPFGENIKKTKRTLYKLADPFLLFWYNYIFPNQSILEADLINEVYKNIKKTLNLHVALLWKEIARESISFLNISGIKWKPASRWWGHGKNGELMEIDIVAESFDRKNILLGEAKWSKNTNLLSMQNKLRKYKDNLPFIKNKNVIYAFWIKQKSKTITEKNIFFPKDILKLIK